jgi:type IV pilus assembly protein PilE
MKKTYLSKGFTLIELLVVIAIIGILSSVVLASLNTARAKGANAAIKSNLTNARAQAEIYYDSNSNVYTNVCTTASTANGVQDLVQAAATAGGWGTLVTAIATPGSASTAVCHSNAAGWAASVPLKQAEGSNTQWCVDYTGVSAGRTTWVAANAVQCP